MRDVPTNQHIPHRHSLKAAIKFLIEVLPAYPNFWSTVEVVQNEPNLNFELTKFLQNNIRKEDLPFNVTQECPSKSNRKEDLCFYIFDRNQLDFSPIFFTIECKRLPTPENREQTEYVYTNNGVSGAIQRYRKNLHGYDIETRTLIPANGIIAYIEENEFQFWQEQINNWINECIGNNNCGQLEWSQNDLLRTLLEISNDERFSPYLDCVLVNGQSEILFLLYSLHRREESKQDLFLIHFWIKMN